MNFSIFFRKFCVTPVVSHVFLKIFPREIGARLPKNVPICACPTFDRCVLLRRGSKRSLWKAAVRGKHRRKVERYPAPALISYRKKPAPQTRLKKKSYKGSHAQPKGPRKLHTHHFPLKSNGPSLIRSFQ